MKFPCWHRRHLRILRAHRHAAEAEHIKQRVEAQWPEVRELSTWARRTREQNHLTELFYAQLRGGKS